MGTPSKGVKDQWRREKDAAEEQAFEMWLAGNTWKQIGDHFGKSYTWARRLVKRRLDRGQPLN
jgi:hypothetical protein